MNKKVYALIGIFFILTLTGAGCSNKKTVLESSDDIVIGTPQKEITQDKKEKTTRLTEPVPVVQKQITTTPAPEPEYTYTIYNTTNAAEGFGYINENAEYYKEKSLPIIAVERENIKILVPEGYEALAKAHIEDLITCQPLLSDFFGDINFPEDELVMKIYVSIDNSNQGSSLAGKIIYRRSQDAIDTDLQNVVTNSSQGFLYNSSATYCANTHELTHAFFNSAPLPSFGDEGLAQFTQKHNQGDIFDHIDCQDNGYYSDDELNVYSDMSSDNVLDYNTAMCFVEELIDTYGWNNFYAMLARLNKYQTGELVWNSLGTHHFVKDVLEYVYGSEVLDVLSKYGIEEEDYEL